MAEFAPQGRITEPRSLGMAGLAVGGCMLTGFAGLVTAAVISIDKDSVDNPGYALISAALAFGLLANALLRR